MFFDSEDQIAPLIKSSGFTIFVLNRPVKIPEKEAKTRLKRIKTAQTKPPKIEISLPLPPEKTTYVSPEKSGKTEAIRVDQIRELAKKTKTKETSARYIIVSDADKMNDQAENAFLKLLEEPRENYHFAFFVKSAENLLPTVLSRAKIYILRQNHPLDAPVNASDEEKILAKKLISANSRELLSLATELSDKKKHKNPRKDALKIIEIAIEIAYKSYFVTKNPKILNRLKKLITLDQNLRGNGHLKLHLIADLC